MCDVKKYEKIYEDIKTLQTEDTLQLVLEAETEEQRLFMRWWVISFCKKSNGR